MARKISWGEDGIRYSKWGSPKLDMLSLTGGLLTSSLVLGEG